jgi:hypothetical protein
MPEELKPGQMVLVPTPNFERLTFARIICSYDGDRYCVRFDDGKLARMTTGAAVLACRPVRLSSIRVASVPHRSGRNAER